MSRTFLEQLAPPVEEVAIRSDDYMRALTLIVGLCEAQMEALAQGEMSSDYHEPLAHSIREVALALCGEESLGEAVEYAASLIGGSVD